MEPAPAAPARRFEAMRALADAGIRVGLSLSPVVPGLNDRDIPALLERARDAGATSAFFTLLRLPAEVLPVFQERLESSLPDRAAKVWSQIRDVRGGRLNDPRYGRRMSGTGPRWDVVRDLFRVHCARLGLAHDEETVGPQATTYRRPSSERTSAQGTLFDV
jgi:DNA repair photolyase